ncbi:MAG: anthranilate phosphoribosyltransferase [Verrucomicrobiota bacterium]|jgi:anthranilate phosphoribosyltransferase
MLRAVLLPDLIAHLAARADLSEAQVQAAIAELVCEDVTVELKADFLSALARKGECISEIAAFASALRERAVAVPLDEATRDRTILDVVGTGGDKLNTFNISSTAALLCAAAGVTVAKHGNRAATSASGSADVLEALGVPLHLTPSDAAVTLRERGFAFLFAPNYHPAFKNIAPARKLCAARGQRTIFNFLGPLLNPARPTAMLLGVARPEMCEPIARVLQTLGVHRAMVVCGDVPLSAADGENRMKEGRAESPSTGAGIVQLDEISTLGTTTVAEFYQERGFTVSRFNPEHFPLQPATLSDLVGGDKQANAETARRILNGQERGPKRDAVLLNAAAALFVGSRVRSMAEGWELAEQLISSGAATAKLEQITR